ncbi:MAG TPA: hypothetical protein VNJ52_02925 [Patescibacteria group bacterium]|nr:hypothetical protein [Patescibacteria group bacterium]
MLIAAIVAVLSLIGLILSITSGLVTAGVDGVFIILVCLLTLAIFGLMFLEMAAKAGVIPMPGRFRRDHK